MTAQQGIDLLFQVADRQRIGRRFVALDERSFQLFDFRFLRRSKIAPAEFETRVLDFLQDVTQLAGGAFGGGRRIIEFVSQARGKFA